MVKRNFLAVVVVSLMAAGCAGGDNDVALLTTTTTPPTKSVVVLQNDGLMVADQELAFGSDQDSTLAKSTAALGEPITSSATCPEGGYDYTEAQYRSVTLLFSENKFAGWRTDSEAYETPEGAYVGSTTDFMLEAYEDFVIDDESTIENEWFASDYRGTLTDDLEEVASMSAGLTCIVR